MKNIIVNETYSACAYCGESMRHAYRGCCGEVHEQTMYDVTIDGVDEVLDESEYEQLVLENELEKTKQQTEQSNGNA